MKKPTLPATWLLGIAFLVVVLAGCSSAEQQAGPVARVDDEKITRSAVERWERFENEIREQMGLRSRSNVQFEADVLQSLLEVQWVEKEAADRGLSLKPEEREAAVADFQIRIGLFPRMLDEARSSARLSEQAFEARAAAEMLKKALAAQGVESAVSPAVLRRYYRMYVSKLGEPEKRTFNFLVTRSEERAMRGERALERGDTWKAVAARYSHPRALRELGWQMAEVTRADIREHLGPELADVAFRARLHELLGPGPVSSGWMVFEVVKVTPSFRPSFKLARQAVRNQLLERRQEAALVSLEQELRTKYRDETWCAADFEIPWCRPMAEG